MDRSLGHRLRERSGTLSDMTTLVGAADTWALLAILLAAGAFGLRPRTRLLGAVFAP